MKNRLCLTGTYRKVGSATFVLTDDLVGIGTRRQLWAEFEREADALRKSALDKVSAAIYAQQPAPDIPAFSESLAFSPEQRELSARKRAEVLGVLALSDTQQVELPLSQLTPQQQDAARRIHAAYSRRPERTLEGTILVKASPVVELLLPSLDGPVWLNFGVHNLFEPYQSRMRRFLPEARRPEQPEPGAARPQPLALPPADLDDALRSVPRLAVYARPRTLAQADALLDSMKRLGLSELWLDVFSGGVTHLPGLPLCAPEAKPAEDVLARAVEVGKGSGIRVYAVPDLLHWGKQAPAEAQDLTLLGETSAQAQARHRRRAEMSARAEGRVVSLPGPAATEAGTVVSALAPAVRESLRTLISALARRPGVAGLVWRETAPPGYALPAQTFHLDAGDPVPPGYSEAMRLAFLRQWHSDPLDVFPSEYRQGRANTKLPNVDDVAIDRELNRLWRQFRSDVNVAFLRTLVEAVPSGGAGTTELPILLQARGDSAAWYGSWDRPDLPPPSRKRSFSADEPYQDEVTQAKSQSRAALLAFPVREGIEPRLLAPALKHLMKNGRWDGLVLDLVSAAGDSPAPLLRSKRAPGGATPQTP